MANLVVKFLMDDLRAWTKSIKDTTTERGNQIPKDDQTRQVQSSLHFGEATPYPPVLRNQNQNLLI